MKGILAAQQASCISRSMGKKCHTSWHLYDPNAANTHWSRNLDKKKCTPDCVGTYVAVGSLQPDDLHRSPQCPCTVLRDIGEYSDNVCTSLGSTKKVMDIEF